MYMYMYILITFPFVVLYELFHLDPHEFNWDESMFKQTQNELEGILDVLQENPSLPTTKPEEAVASCTPQAHESLSSGHKGAFLSTEGKTPLSDCHLMLSYNWATLPLVRKLKMELRAAGLNTWMDEDYMYVGHGSLNETLAYAIDKAALVLVCYSTEYTKSPICRKEAEYAEMRNKPIIFVCVEKQFKPDSWLANLMSNHLSYDISDDDEQSFQENIFQLIVNISSILGEICPNTSEKTEEAQNFSENTPPLPNSCEVSVGQHLQNWSVEDVQNLLDQLDLDVLKSRYV